MKNRDFTSVLSLIILVLYNEPIFAAGTSISNAGITFPDGSVQTSASPTPSNIAWVAVSSGDYSTPKGALDNLSDWCGTPAGNNTCLIKIAPGTFNVGTTPLVMMPYVSIEGSGINVTIVEGNVSTTEAASSAIIHGSTYSQISNLTIRNKGGDEYSIGIYNENVHPYIVDIKVEAYGGIQNRGIQNESSAMFGSQIFITVSEGDQTHCLYNRNGSTEFFGVTCSATSGKANNGVYNFNEHSKIESSKFKVIGDGLGNRGIFSSGSTFGIYKNVKLEALGDVSDWNNSSVCDYSATVSFFNSELIGYLDSFCDEVRVANSLINGEFRNCCGAVYCVGSYNANYDPLGKDCL